MTTRQERELRSAMVRIGRALYDRGLVVATDGNLSARLDGERLLATPSGLCKGWLREEQLIVVDMGGKRVDEPNAHNRDLRPTSELAMHLEAYRVRPDVRAVVHAHPPHAVAQSIAGVGFEDCFLPEALLFVGIPFVAEYATPSSAEGAAAIREGAAQHDLIVLQRHGSLALATSLEEAYFRTETLEQLARIRGLVVQAQAGDRAIPALAAEQVEKLMALRRGLGLWRPGDAERFCEHCGACVAGGDARNEARYYVEARTDDSRPQSDGRRDLSKRVDALPTAGSAYSKAAIREVVRQVLRSFDDRG